MSALAGIITLLSTVGLGLLITRIATVALMFTGVSKDLARFQARSAFTCCGFTTSESERLMDHPVRRRIVMLLMLLGNGVVVMAISSLIPVFLDTGQEGFRTQELAARILLLMAGIAVIWAISISKWIDKRLSAIIAWALRKFTHLDVQDYHSLLRLSEGYSVTELSAREGAWMVGKSLSTLRLADEGVQVLGIRRSSGEYVGTPTGTTYIRNGDTLLVYGRADQLVELENRKAGPEGDQEHERRRLQQQAAIEEQQNQDRRRGRNATPTTPTNSMEEPSVG
ncbi:MAG TPA: TrkA C-terminal domain-containing protein [Candidatus Hydrogenedentes bacterium]|nr:TrkA C-terminal domain-containing protein [Candidatus Hydrogenedentota bacterium]HOL77880.1 TrkA C-terminal domain-containing protein [Candidatus Hydrogenedentota bacterium]HPO87045.1 TrkA C-terminal domain-containing protein [Candidatus Hydrogenedentota bacterium]